MSTPIDVSDDIAASDGTDVVQAAQAQGNVTNPIDEKDEEDDRHLVETKTKCVLTLTRLIISGGKWWAFQKWLSLLPGFSGIHEKKARALLEKETFGIFRDSKGRARTENETTHLVKFFQEFHAGLVQGINKEELKILAQKARFINVESRRKVLFEQGSLGNHFYIVLRGRVLIIANNINMTKHSDQWNAKKKYGSPDNQLNLIGTHVATIRAGEAFGELALANKESRRMASALAVFNTALIEIDRDTYDLTMKGVREKSRRFEENVKYFKTLPMFEGFTRLRIVNLTYEMTECKMAFGTSIQNQGFKTKGMYFLLEGEASVFHVSEKTGSLIQLPSKFKPSVFGIRHLMYRATEFLKKGAFCPAREKCSVVVNSAHARLLFLPLKHFSLFIEKLKDTKGFQYFKRKIKEQNETVEKHVNALLSLSSRLHKNDDCGKVKPLYFDNAPLHSPYRKSKIQCPSPKKSRNYGAAIKRYNCTIEDLNAEIEVKSAILQLREEKVALPSFSSIAALNRKKREEAQRESPVPPPATHMSDFDKSRFKYLQSKRRRWLLSANMKHKKRVWKKKFKLLAADEFDMGNDRKIYDSHGRVVAQVKT
jgi:CRP-like cAMP-binding protein